MLKKISNCIIHTDHRTELLVLPDQQRPTATQIVFDPDNFFFFFKLFLSDTFTCPILGPLVPLFWISGNVSSGFQSQSGFCLIRIAEANVMYIT